MKRLLLGGLLLWILAFVLALYVLHVFNVEPKEVREDAIRTMDKIDGYDTNYDYHAS